MRTTVGPSGLTVVTEAMADVRSVALGFWVGAGSRDEAPAEAGASHFLEHLLFKGTPTRTATEIAQAVEAVGGEMNAFTSKDHTAFYVRLLAADLDLGLDVLTDIIWNPAFRPDEVETERAVILEEILMQRDEPDDVAHELLSTALWPGHPLGREVLGDETTIGVMPVATISAFHSGWYRPGAMVFAAAGRVDHDTLVDALEARFARSGRPSGGDRPAREAPGGVAVPLVVQRRKSEQAHLVLGVPGPSRHDPDRHAATLLVQVLGGGASSRLFQEVREKRGLAYSVDAFRHGYDDAGLVAVYAAMSPRRAAETLRVISGEIERLVAGVTDRELEVARGGIIGALSLGLEDSGARMHRIGRAQLLHGTVPAVEEVIAGFEAVTHDDLVRVATRLASAPRSLAVVGPFSEEQVTRWAA